LISGLILAAGKARRMGTPKQVVKIGGKPMLQHVVDSFLASSLGEVVVVVRPGLPWKPKPSRRLRVVVNSRFGEGISSSVKFGLSSLSSGSEATVIGLGDKPLLLPSTIERLLVAYRRSGSKIVVPTYNRVRGNPILFQKSLYPWILELKGDVGAKRVINSNESEVLEVSVDDEGVLLDVNTPSDLERAVRTLASRTRSVSKRKPRK